MPQELGPSTPTLRRQSQDLNVVHTTIKHLLKHLLVATTHGLVSLLGILFVGPLYFLSSIFFISFFLRREWRISFSLQVQSE